MILKTVKSQNLRAGMFVFFGGIPCEIAEKEPQDVVRLMRLVLESRDEDEMFEFRMLVPYDMNIQTFM